MKLCGLKDMTAQHQTVSTIIVLHLSYCFKRVKGLTIPNVSLYIEEHLHKHASETIASKSFFLPFVFVTFEAEHKLAFLAHKYRVHL